MAQTQSLDARDSSDLQDNKAMAAKRMKGMGDFSRSQRLTGLQCSSMGLWRRYATGLFRQLR